MKAPWFSSPATIRRGGRALLGAALLTLVQARGLRANIDITVLDVETPAACTDPERCVSACVSRNADACYHMGLIFHYQIWRGNDDAMAAWYFRNGCEAGSDRACWQLGEMLADEGPEGELKAAEVWSRGCARSGLYSCRSLAYLPLPEGAGETERRRQEELLERTAAVAANECSSGSYSSCFALMGMRIKRGRLAELPPRAAADALRLGEIDCNNGDGSACIRLAWHHQAENNRSRQFDAKDWENWNDYFSRAESAYLDRCLRRPEWLTCRNYMAINDRSATDRDVEANDLLWNLREEWVNGSYLYACDANDASSCERAADTLVDEDPEKAASLYQKACDGGQPDACRSLAWMLETGAQVAQNLPRALALFESSCAQRGCAELAALYSLGTVVPQDRMKARAYEERGCSMGDFCACAYLEREKTGSERYFWCTHN